MPPDSDEMHDNMPRPVAEGHAQAITPHHTTDSDNKTVVIGLYGISGCGKTHLLNQLKQELRQEHFAFYEGSEMIASVVPGGLLAFQTLRDQEKTKYRELAISKIRQECVDRGRVGVVTGHSRLWNEEGKVLQQVFTERDKNTYSHILYLDVPAELIEERRLHDWKKGRPPAKVSDLRGWQEDEKNELRAICRKHGILFSLVSPQRMLDKVRVMLLDFQHHTEKYNLSQAERKLDEAVTAAKPLLKTVLAIDADRTLAAEDTGVLFWNKVSNSRLSGDVKNTLKTLFGDLQWQYSYAAFRQATLLYQEATEDDEFNQICDDIASGVNIHQDFVALLQKVAHHKHIGAVVITCGLRRVWEKVLDNAGLSRSVKVIGGGRIADGFVVTPMMKATLVNRLQTVHRTYVWAFGDSPMDLEMLSKADQAIVVVGEEETRSKTMSVDLENAIRDGSLRARQVLLPSSASPRLDTARLPIVRLTDDVFINLILNDHRHDVCLDFHHATNTNAAKLLMTPMRDATVSGPDLRKAHHRVGRYLATKFLTDVIGLEKCPILHVQGHQTDGYRLLNEEYTLIVPLMRGGEPIALGVNDAFPLAMLLHAKSPDDIEIQHLQGRNTIVLVDAVINSGKTMAEFIQRVRDLRPAIRIVLLAGVVQTEAIRRGSHLHALGCEKLLSLVALRRSDNKFTGRGTTDTGNRLFNTTHLS